jgi:hypothetical protein
MLPILQAISGIIGLVALVCFVLVVVKMFQAGDTTMGIICVVGVLACGIGVLVAFVYGWIKSSEYKIQQVMLIWTAAIVVNIVLSVATVVMTGGDALQQIQQEIELNEEF